MLELIFGIVGGAIYLFWKAAVFVFKIFVKLSPILLIIFAIMLSSTIGTMLFDGLINLSYIQNVQDDYTHKVTVYWDAEGREQDTFYVREDLNWILNDSILDMDSENDYDYLSFYTDVSVEADLPDIVLEKQTDGKRFAGLFTSPYGIEQYTDRNGYSLKTVTYDIVLYAIWE